MAEHELSSDSDMTQRPTLNQVPRWEDIQGLPLAAKVATIRASLSFTAPPGVEGDELECLRAAPWKLMAEARLRDPDVDVEIRELYEKGYAPGGDPPAPERLVLRPGQAPRLAGCGPDEPERYLTYDDTRYWPLRARLEADLHAKDYERTTRTAGRDAWLKDQDMRASADLIDDNSSVDSSLRALLRYAGPEAMRELLASLDDGL